VAYEWIVAAADRFRPVYDGSDGQSGYVSIELPPALARNHHETVRTGYELAKRLDRPNLMIKVPGTPPGLAAASDLLARRIPINVTLLFDPKRFDAVARAYFDGVSRLPASAAGAQSPACVASFFVSRIDTAVDRLLKVLADTANESAAREVALLLGSAGLSCAEATWARYQAFVHEHARVQAASPPRLRLLWASTSVKDKSYSPLKYVRPLMRPGTITTMSRDTLNEWIRGAAGITSANLPAPDLPRLRARLQDIGIGLDGIIATLEEQGLQLFHDSFGRMMRALAPARAAIR
jgi:transaldolase/glucose-6-phosphate isomerase